MITSSNSLFRERDAQSSGRRFNVAEWLRVFAVRRVRFARGTARYRTWREVAEVIGAIDLYRIRHLRSLPTSMSLFPVIVSNGTFTSTARKEALERDVELMGDIELWKLLNQTPCTRAELEVMENRRVESMRDVQAALNGFGI